MVRISSPEALVRAYGRNPVEIARAIDIPFHRLWRPESALPGLTCLVANRPSIFINDAYFAKLQQKDRDYTDEMLEYDVLQVIAHELGHACLHRQELQQAPIKEYEIFDVRTPLEADANEFAAVIRIDTDRMLRLLRSDMTILQVAKDMHVNVNLLIYMIERLRKQGVLFNDLPYIPKNNFMGSISGAGSSEWN